MQARSCRGIRGTKARARGAVTLLALSGALLAPTAARADLTPGSFAFDDAPAAMATAPDGTTYVARVQGSQRPLTGAGVVVPADAGAPGIPGAGRVAGQIEDVVADGAGGWYVAGALRAVGGVAVGNVARLRADGSLDRAWSARVARPDGRVWRLALLGDRLYLAGEFPDVGGADRNGLAALDTATGAVTDWAPEWSALTTALVASGDTVYVAGNAGPRDAQPLVALDAATGAARAWDPAPDGQVTSLAVADGTVYAAGDFARIGGADRLGLAALDASGTATAWDPAPDAHATAVAVAGGLVYAAGAFDRIAGVARSGLAALDRGTGAATDWAPAAGTAANTLAVGDGTVFVAGGDGGAGSVLERFDRATGATTGDEVPVNGRVGALAVAAGGGPVYAGGTFVAAGPAVGGTSAIARIRADGGLDTSFDVGGGFVAVKLALDGDTLVGVGAAYDADGYAGPLVVSVDLATGRLTRWATRFGGGTPQAVALDDDAVYLAGDFSSVDGAQRDGLAKLDRRTGALTAWTPRWANGDRHFGGALAITGSTLHAAAVDFDTDGVLLAALDTGTGAAAGPELEVSGGYVSALAAGDGGRVYVGGDFRSVGDARRDGLAAVDAGTGALASWAPALDNNGVVALAALRGTVYVAGYVSVPSDTPPGFVLANDVVALDAATGAAEDWTGHLGAPTVSAFELTAVGDVVRVVGDINRLGRMPAGSYVQGPTADAPPPFSAIGRLLLRPGPRFLARGGGLTAAAEGLTRTRSSGAFAFPVSTSLEQIVDARGVISQRGTLRFRAATGAGSLALTDPQVDLFASQLTAVVDGQRIPVLALDYTRAAAGEDDGFRFGPVVARLTEQGAAAFTQAFGGTAFRAGRGFGSLVIDVRRARFGWPAPVTASQARARGLRQRLDGGGSKPGNSSPKR